jgi:hypothetical protein
MVNSRTAALRTVIARTQQIVSITGFAGSGRRLIRIRPFFQGTRADHSTMNRHTVNADAIAPRRLRTAHATS